MMRSPRHAANEVPWLDADGNVGANVPCLSCRASLRGRPLNGTCACGRDIFDTIRDRLPAIDYTGHIADDLSCGRCGYNLRTLFVMDACPECAAPVARAARSNLLRYADPAWVRRVCRGANKLFWGCFGMFIVPAVGALPMVLAPAPDVVYPLLMLMAFVGAVAGSRGLIELTAPEPGRDESGRWTARRFARLSAWVPPVAVVSGAAALLTPPSVLPEALIAVVALLLLGVPVVVFPYLHELGTRIPAGDLAASIRFFAISWLCLVALLGCLMLMRSDVVMILAAWAGMWTLIVLIAGFVALGDLQKRLAAAADQARANAAQEFDVPPAEDS